MNRIPYAAPNAEPEDDLWHPEVMSAETICSDGAKCIGTDESWIQLTWNLEHRTAWLTLYVASRDAANIVTELMDTLLDFRLFLEAL